MTSKMCARQLSGFRRISSTWVVTIGEGIEQSDMYSRMRCTEELKAEPAAAEATEKFALDLTGT